MKRSPRTSYVDLIMATVAGKSRQDLRDGNAESTVLTLGEIALQARSDWRMDQRDVDVVGELVESWIRFIRFPSVEEGPPSPTP